MHRGIEWFWCKDILLMGIYWLILACGRKGVLANVQFMTVAASLETFCFSNSFILKYPSLI